MLRYKGPTESGWIAGQCLLTVVLFSCSNGVSTAQSRLLEASRTYERAFDDTGSSKDGPLRAWRMLEQRWNTEAAVLSEVGCPALDGMVDRINFLRFWTYSLYFYIPEEPGEPIAMHFLEQRGVEESHVRDAYRKISLSYSRSLESELRATLGSVSFPLEAPSLDALEWREFLQWKSEDWGAAGAATLRDFEEQVSRSGCFED